MLTTGWLRKDCRRDKGSPDRFLGHVLRSLAVDGTCAAVCKMHHGLGLGGQKMWIDKVDKKVSASSSAVCTGAIPSAHFRHRHNEC